MTSRVSVVVRGEDTAHINFVASVLQLLGHSRTKIEAKPVGDFDHVRAAYEREIVVLRARTSRGSANHALVIVVDADLETTTDRRHWLEDRLSEKRRAEEPIVFLIPRRNIETWLLHLGDGPRAEVGDDGRPVDYGGGAIGERARDRSTARRAADAFVKAFRARGKDPLVPSLDDALAEMLRLPGHRGK
jgi:hypothetical protein